MKLICKHKWQFLVRFPKKFDILGRGNTRGYMCNCGAMLWKIGNKTKIPSIEYRSGKQ